MKILLLHNRYQLAGGEDRVVLNEQKLLLEHGQEVELFSISNDAIGGPWRAMTTAWRVAYSVPMRKRIEQKLRETRPDVVHVHNFFPLLTPSVYDACLDAGIPVVQTLHNFRTICPGGILFREGRPCEECVGASPYHALRHRCYRNSRLGTLAVANLVRHYRKARSKVACFIVLSHFAKDLFVQAGFPEERLLVKPNFSWLPTRGAPDTERQGALFVGRLSGEKGLDVLLEGWRSLEVPLRIIGEGPLQPLLREAKNPSIDSSGFLPHAEVLEAMNRAKFLVLPSQCYEGFPMAIVEAFSQGLPVIASRLGAMAEVVTDRETGLHFEPNNSADLAAKVRWAAEHPEEMNRMSENARREYEKKYTPEQNCRQLVAIYERAMNEIPHPAFSTTQ